MLFSKTKAALDLYARFGGEHRRSPLAPAALLYAGTLCAGPRMNDFAKAREWFARVAAGHPGTREAEAAEYYTATLAWRGRKWTEAEKLHKAFAAAHPGSPLARVALDERLPAIAKKSLAVPLQAEPHEVVVGPRDRKRKAIPIEQADAYNTDLDIIPANGYKLVGSTIIDHDSRGAGKLWTGPVWVKNAQRYHLSNAHSSQEYVMIDGTIVKQGAGGGGGGGGAADPFRVTVPSVDVDWVGFAASGDENGEETRFVIVPFNTNRVDDIRGVKLNDPFDDDERNLRPNFPYGHPVNPDITLHWEAGNELGLPAAKTRSTTAPISTPGPPPGRCTSPSYPQCRPSPARYTPRARLTISARRPSTPSTGASSTSTSTWRPTANPASPTETSRRRRTPAVMPASARTT